MLDCVPGKSVVNGASWLQLGVIYDCSQSEFWKLVQSKFKVRFAALLLLRKNPKVESSKLGISDSEYQRIVLEHIRDIKKI